MKNDIVPPPAAPRPPREPENVPPVEEVLPQSAPTPTSPILGDILQQSQGGQTEVLDKDAPQPSKNPWNKYYNWIFIIIGVLVLIGAIWFTWYQFALRPVMSGDPERVRVTVIPGSSPTQIGALLAEKKVIRSKMAFDIYVRLNSVRSKLRAGTYSLSPAESTAQIVDHLTTGEAEQFDVTFYPGATLNIASNKTDKTPSHRQVLQKLGYEDSEIDEAFSASYIDEYPVLFKDMPTTADLEGYIYGQTYKIASGSTVKQILRRTFAEYEKQIKDSNLVEAFNSHGLSLYEGITLASIIQREVQNPADQRQVAQVFYKRLAIDMELGADATFVYAARKLDVPPSVDLDSPYNTRKHKGLPPGPISSPGIGALQAVANPVEGDYLFFVSGDDGTNYFSRTLEEHEAKTQQYCRANCSLF